MRPGVIQLHARRSSWVSLKLQLQCELHNAWISDGSGDYAEIASRHVAVRSCEVRRVGDVKRLDADLRGSLFLDVELFEQGHVRIDEARAAHEIASGIPDIRAAETGS